MIIIPYELLFGPVVQCPTPSWIPLYTCLAEGIYAYKEIPANFDLNEIDYSSWPFLFGQSEATILFWPNKSIYGIFKKYGNLRRIYIIIYYPYLENGLQKTISKLLTAREQIKLI